jgi:hypothetical protein
MFEFMFQIVDHLNSKGKNVAVLMLAYGKSPPRLVHRRTTKKWKTQDFNMNE